MDLLAFCKSILLVFIVYLSFILNNSFVSYLLTNYLLISLILALILSDLSFTGYKLLFSNDPGIEFFLSNCFLWSFLCLNYPFFDHFFLIFVGLLFYTFLSSILSFLASSEDQLLLSSLSSIQAFKDFTIHTHHGLIFDTFYVYYSKSLCFMTKVDKRNFFDLIKNNNGTILFSDETRIKFVLSMRGLKYFSYAKDNLIRNITDIDNMISNLLFD